MGHFFSQFTGTQDPNLPLYFFLLYVILNTILVAFASDSEVVIALRATFHLPLNIIIIKIISSSPGNYSILLTENWRMLIPRHLFANLFKFIPSKRTNIAWVNWDVSMLYFLMSVEKILLTVSEVVHLLAIYLWTSRLNYLKLSCISSADTISYSLMISTRISVPLTLFGGRVPVVYWAL